MQRRLGVILMALALGAVGAAGSNPLPNPFPKPLPLVKGMAPAVSPGVVVPGYGGPVSELEAAGAGLETATPTDTKRVKGSFIVALAPGIDPQKAAADIAREYGGEAKLVYDHVIGGFEFVGPDDAGLRLARDPRVRSVQPDHEMHLAESTAATHLHADNAPGGTWYTTLPYRGAGVRIGILDTGADLNHPWIKNNIETGLSYAGCVGESSVQDQNGHGTRTTSNAVGTIGVAPDAHAVIVKVFPGGSSSTSFSAIACGVNYIVGLNQNGSNPVRVVNASIAGSAGAGTCSDGSLRQAVCQLVGTRATSPPVTTHAAFFAAAGNSGVNTSGVAPANFPESIAVSAFDCSNFDCIGGTPNFASSFSDYGSTVDIGAPGVSIYSALLGTTGGTTATGTSRSSPQAAGAAADLISAGVGPDQVKSALQAGGRCPTSNRTKTSAGNCATGTWPSDTIDGVAEPFLDVAGAIAGAGPTVQFVSPANGSHVTGTATFKVSVTSSRPLRVSPPPVVISPCSTAVTSPSANVYQCDWTVTGTEGSSQTVTASATDNTNATGTATPISVVVDNTDNPPVVTWSTPTNNATVAPSFTVKVTASDDRNTPTVCLKIDPPTATCTPLSGPTSGLSGTYTGNVSNLSTGQHVLEADASDGAGGHTTTAAIPVTVSVSTTWTRVDDNSSSVAYPSGWASAAASCTYGGAYHYSNVTGAELTYSFTGTGVHWITAVAPNLGKAEVWVEGDATHTFVDTYNGSQTCQLIKFERVGLISGPHTLHVSVTGTKNAASSGTYIIADAFEYQH